MLGEQYALATVHPTLGQRNKASALALLLICSCVLALPLAAARVPHFDSLILIFDSTLTLAGLVVAVLLFTQFRVTRTPAVLALACGLLLMSLTTVPQLLRAAQGASIDLRLQFVSDLSLPAAAIAYALLRRGSAARVDAVRVASIIFGGVAASVALAALATWVTAASGEPGVGVPTDEVPLLWRVLATALLCTTLAAAITLLWRGDSSVLGLWLLVTLVAWLLGALLRAVVADHGSVSWLFARSYEVLGTACMMLALLAENATLYSRLARMIGIRGLREQGDATASVVETISNEVNQPLCAITANADAIARLLDQPRPDFAEVRAALDDIVGDAKRASDALHNAQRMMAGANEAPAVIDVGQLVGECLSQLRTELSSRSVTCEVSTAEQLPDIRGFRRQLLQMLINLVTSSLEAMSGVQHQRCLRVRAQRHDEGTVAIWVEDSGVGIRDRSGIDLAVCRTIVDAHGGHLTVAAGEDGGAAFKVVLPASS